MKKSHDFTIDGSARPESSTNPATRWLLASNAEPVGHQTGPHGRQVEEQRSHWLRVMCLTGLDYFSTLGYQPAIAALAAGAIAPLATIVLVLVTLLGALPVYRKVAAESPNGAGSIAMLANLLPRWGGKLVVLGLLGFAATDFMITMTLSAADATAHLVENPFAPAVFQGQEVVITLALLAGLGIVFLRGFSEAIRVAVVLVGVFLTLNAIVIAVAIAHMASTPIVLSDWWGNITTQHDSPFMMVAVALLVFPKLALGLSGFETGVAVMPQIRGDVGDTEAKPTGRIRGARKLLLTSALTMSAFLIASSITTVTLIPEAEFQPGGKANGRALAYLAHEFLGNGFGTTYDVATIAILWFAGASAMAGLLNLVPRYLPRYGMAPEWARAIRPLVLVFTGIAFLITILFEADVDRQGGAYATGVLVLITSAAVAVALTMHRRRARGSTIIFGSISVLFGYTTVANIIERPDGIKIAGWFILGIVAVSFVSRLSRATELRARSVRLDERATRIVAGAAEPLRLVAHDPKDTTRDRYATKLRHAGLAHHLDGGSIMFLEVCISDASDFEGDLVVSGADHDGFQVLTVTASSVPNAIAAVALRLRDIKGSEPHLYFRWNEGNPFANFARFLIFGEGEIAPMTREILREAEPDVHRRPWIHVA